MTTYRQIFYHIVFGKKNRECSLAENHQEALYRFIWGVINKRQCHLYRIGGTEDHLHIFSDLHPAIALADFVKEIKVASSNWIKLRGTFPHFTRWQEGYGAFTCSVNERDAVIAYIKNQKLPGRIQTAIDRK